MRLACDTGGTFTDLVVEADGELRMYKASTTPDDPVARRARRAGAGRRRTTAWRSRDFLARGETFIHGTTRAINAILTGSTARTAFLTTEGHPDILVIREGGRIEPFNFTVPYPEPYVPRALTFEMPERIDAAGEVVTPLDEAAVRARDRARCASKRVEAVGVCLLWSIVNPGHEQRVGELLAEHLPGVPFTLSHRAQPDAARVPPRLLDLHRRLAEAADVRLPARADERACARPASPGRVLMVTSQGGMMDADDVAEAPIHAIGSGPAMAPVAGRHYAARDAGTDTADRRRHRRHQLRRQPGAPGPHPVDPRDLARPALPRPHDRLPLGRRQEHRRRRRLDRLGRRGRPAARRPAERRRDARARPATAAAAPSRPSPTARCVLGYIDPGVLPRRRDAPRPRGRARGARAARSRARSASALEEAAAAVAGARDREDGRRDRGDHGQPGHRSAPRRS